MSGRCKWFIRRLMLDLSPTSWETLTCLSLFADKSSQYASSQYASPQYASPQYASSQYASSQYAHSSQRDARDTRGAYSSRDPRGYSSKPTTTAYSYGSKGSASTDKSSSSTHRARVSDRAVVSRPPPLPSLSWQDIYRYDSKLYKAIERSAAIMKKLKASGKIPPFRPYRPQQQRIRQR